VRVAVVGAGGQLAAAVLHEWAVASPSDEVVPFTRQQLDVGDDEALAKAIRAVQPAAIVNCAGYNAVDAAEDHPVDALQVNAFAVRTLARLAEELGAALVHYGSDFVLDGEATEPYTEDTPPCPRSVYGASKMLGEWFALDAPRAYVLRVESLFGRAPDGPPSRGSIATIMNGLLSGSSPLVFEDRTVSPTYVRDAARATRQLLTSAAPPGLYHCVNSGMCTWLEFATELARQMGVAPKLTPVRTGDVPMRAQRPRFCALSNGKLRRAGIDMPDWRDAVTRFLRDDAGVKPRVG
jgi:dTDP-4-dehydrorhamnose reductase